VLKFPYREFYFHFNKLLGIFGSFQKIQTHPTVAAEEAAIPITASPKAINFFTQPPPLILFFIIIIWFTKHFICNWQNH